MRPFCLGEAFDPKATKQKKVTHKESSGQGSKESSACSSHPAQICRNQEVDLLNPNFATVDLLQRNICSLGHGMQDAPVVFSM